MNNEIQEIRYQVGEAWKGTYNAATTYGNANVVQDPTGLSVYRSLKPGNVGHPLTDTAWWFLIIDLSSIKEESDRIKALNDAIAADEAQRVENENGRVTAEQGRVYAETARVTAEQGRVSAEQQRVSAEQQRASQEQTRISQEQSRVTAEQGRVAAEAQRVQKEQLRENNEEQRVINETNRVAAEAERVEQYTADHQQAVADHEQYVDFLGVFDLSKHNAVGGVLATYADMSAALTALNALDSKYKYGGMSFKFVQSSDNKYVQYFLTKDEWSASAGDWEKMNLEEEVSQLGQKVDDIDKELHENETVSPTLQRSGYYVNTNGTRDYYSPFGIFTPIPVKSGDRVVATIDGYNSDASPISWGATDNTFSDMSVTPLAVYTPTNHYDVTIENDGYLIVCGDKTTNPIVTIYGEMYDFEQIEVNKENIAEIKDALTEEKFVPISEIKASYFVRPDGTRDNVATLSMFGGIQVFAGERFKAVVPDINPAVCPASWEQTLNTNSDMLATPLTVYDANSNEYTFDIPADGYLIISGSKAQNPTLYKLGYFDLEQINEDLSKTEELVQDLEEKLVVDEDVAVTLGSSGYYVNTSGTRGYYAIMGIFGPIPVQKWDKVSAKNMLSENEAIAALAWSESPDMSSGMSCTVLALGISTGDATTEYKAEIPGNGYLFISANKNTTPTLTIYRVPSYNSLFEDVEEIEGVLSDNKQIPVVIDKNGYFVNTSGTRGNYAPYAIFSTVSVKAGDKIIVGNIYVNSAICPLAFNTDGNTTSTMVATPMSVFEDGKTIYSAVAPQDGYFIVSNDKTKTPTVEIAKLLDIPEIKQIGSLLSGKITMLFGDSLTAGSTTGVVAFGRVIANVLGIPYRAFVYDRFDPSPDTNAADVDIDIPSITNYGKDGTKNQLTTGRVDSVLQRIKNHITADTNVDYVLVECCVNDYTSGTKGAISAGFTGPFDENTAIGAIEETCRYLTTLGKDIRLGFYIPWQISYVPESYFDDYIAVFEKWCVPLFDMRKCAGFNMRWCTRHQELYSLPASSYANYDNTATYNLDDKVKYERFLYKCNADGVTGIPPTNETYWTKVSEGSFDGCHLNSLGHYIVAGKIQSFMESL